MTQKQQGTATPRGGSLLRRLIAGILGLILSGLVVLGGGLYFAIERFERPGPSTEATTVTIPRGAGVAAIARQLADAGVVEHPWLVIGGARVVDPGRPIQAGEYEIPARASAREVLKLLRSGRTIVHRITIPEGLTSRQIVELLRLEELLTGDIASIPAEGTLLPETYHFNRGDPRQAILDRMAQAMEQALAELWPQRAEGLPFDTPEEAVTLASIVEKETGLPVERPRVASVFVNRMRIGMRLQADPTVVYAVTGGSGPLGRPLTSADLKLDSPYNTYVHTGLPPGPIANPGRESLAAVLNPAQTKDLYFVADGSGGHAFAATLAEHNRNVARWRRLQKNGN